MIPGEVQVLTDEQQSAGMDDADSRSHRDLLWIKCWRR
jgi:hypothetical protein